MDGTRAGGAVWRPTGRVVASHGGRDARRRRHLPDHRAGHVGRGDRPVPGALVARGGGRHDRAAGRLDAPAGGNVVAGCLVATSTALVDMLGAPAEVCLASGHSAAHISSIITVPLAAAARSATPNSSATPMPSRPSMNIQFAQGVPAQLWKVDSNGPISTPLRKPLVGEPPLIQALADGVA